MAEVFTSDNSVAQEVMESQDAEIADSLRVGAELEAAHEQRLAGKYRNTEELEAAYLELQQKLGNQDEDVEEYEEDGEEFDDGGLYDILDAYRETGEITDEAIEAINNMSPADVFALMADREAGAQGREMSGEEISAVYQSVGGEQEYGALTSWAAENLSDNEIDTYDAMIESGDLGQISFALQALYYRYTEAMGQDGNMLQGKPAQAQSGFRSQAELVAAMNDPRYDNDPAYRQDVINKLERSDLNF